MGGRKAPNHGDRKHANDADARRARTRTTGGARKRPAGGVCNDTPHIPAPFQNSRCQEEPLTNPLRTLPRLIPPDVPTFGPTSRTQFNLLLCREHRLDSFSHFVGLLAVCPTLFGDKLSYVPSASRLRYFASLCYKTDLHLAHRVIAGVRALLVPYECDCCVFKAPGSYQVECLV